MKKTGISILTDTLQNTQKAPPAFSFAKRWGLLWSMVLLLSQCTVEGPTKVIVLKEGEVLVQQGETIYSIAHYHNVSVRALIAANKLKEPYTIKADQVLVIPQEKMSITEEAYEADIMEEKMISGPELIEAEKGIVWSTIDTEESRPDSSSKENTAATPMENPVTPVEEDLPVAEKTNTKQQQISEEKNTSVQQQEKQKKFSLRTPIKGKILCNFGEKWANTPSLGMHFSIPDVQKVVASAGGKVIFAGKMTKNAPSMVVIRHDNDYVTSYMPVHKICVKKDQKINAGSILGTATKELYFELRKNRKPLDPHSYFTVTPLVKKKKK